MRALDRALETEHTFLDSICSIRSLVRLSPLVALALTLVGTGCKSEVDAELQKCREEVARLEGILLGAGVNPDLVNAGADDSTELKDCKIRQSRLRGLRSSATGVRDPSEFYINGGEGGEVEGQIWEEGPSTETDDGARQIRIEKKLEKLREKRNDYLDDPEHFQTDSYYEDLQEEIRELERQLPGPSDRE